MTDKMPDEIYISQDREYPDTWRDVSWGFDKAPIKYISEQKHAEEIEATKTEWYERGKAGYLEAVAAKQAVIDRLMLEYCPDEMSEQQLDDYSGSQVSVDLCGPQIAALKAEHRADMAGLCEELECLSLGAEYGPDSGYYKGCERAYNDALDEAIELIKQRISDE